jgi:hypothetical protein
VFDIMVLVKENGLLVSSNNLKRGKNVLLQLGVNQNQHCDFLTLHCTNANSAHHFYHSTAYSERLHSFPGVMDPGGSSPSNPASSPYLEAMQSTSPTYPPKLLLK